MVSVSLNVDTSQMYDKICKSRFGKGVYKEIKQFAIECRDNGIEVELSFLDLAGVDIDRCREIAENELKVGFRLRRYNVVG